MSWLKETEAIPEGYWGPIVWTKYIAEPVNTLTNLLFFAAAIYGMYRIYEQKLPARYYGMYFGLGVVGFGSFLFHMTLKHEAQLLDELPMIWTSTYVAWCLLDVTICYGKKKSSPTTALLFFSLATVITVTYVMNGNPVFHQVAYACIFGFTTIHGFYTLWSKNSPLALTASSQKFQAIARHTQFVGITSFLTGFVIWNIDNIFCGTLRGTREIVGYPWALLLEGHGWWHVLTCYGAYLLALSCEIITLPLQEHPDNFVYVRGFLPYLRRLRADDPKHRFVDEYNAKKSN